MNKLIKILKLILVIFSLSFITVFFFPRETFKEFWSIAWQIFMVVMFIRPIKDIFPKCRLFKFIAKFRRELWILVWVFWLAHGIWAFMDYRIMINWAKTYVEIFLEPYIWNYTWYMFWWMLAWILAIPLLITSNWLSTSILWKHWKTLQRLSYFMFIFTWIHIYLIKKEIWALIILWIWVLLFIIAFVKNKKSSKNTTAWPKWLCVPCGYIYDENIWDPDSWIVPWTKFEDIPEDWRCPVCWVWKSDFILIEWEIKTNESKIVSLKYLTDDVIELKVDLWAEVSFVSWQFLTFALTDDVWDFNRSYSVANKEGNIFTFLIKLKPDGRAWVLFKTKKVWDILFYMHISWNFKLQNTKNPKVFIATWTGLAPIYNMLLNTWENVSKKIYFWVANLKDMFYVENLKKFKNLEINLFLSREEVEWYNFWRMDFSKYDFDKNTEFYICWNPWVVEWAKKSLNEKWFDKVFSEEF
jgi:rubredoxin/NAD(P)H-flavin reductase/DMSO/TMAO reductase YedYZ heme-binding membrane subunit